MGTGLSFNEMMHILMEHQGIDAGKRSTFIARLQQLQKLGLPAGSNLGRGMKVRYALWQLADLSLFLVLLDCGVPPGQIAEAFAGKSPFGDEGRGAVIQKSMNRGAYYGLFSFAMLGRLKMDSCADHERLVHYTNSRSEVLDFIGHRPALVVDLSKQLLSLREATQVVFPEALELLRF